jgi:cyclopropane fatty-acyl-phospholipid synthase-like methyltransferase
MDLSILEQMDPRFVQDREFISSIIASLNLPIGSQILDIGTGWGKMSIYLALHGYSLITGEPAKWAEWEKYAQKAGVIDKIHYEKIDAQATEFVSETFDAIFLLGSLHHIPNKNQAFEEFLRILKKDGVIILFDYTNKRIEKIKKHRNHHPPAVNVKKLLRGFPVQYEEILDTNKEVFCFIIKKN